MPASPIKWTHIKESVEEERCCDEGTVDDRDGFSGGQRVMISALTTTHVILVPMTTSENNTPLDTHDVRMMYG